MTIEEAKQLQVGEVLHNQHCKRWRVNGKVKTWKRDHTRVRVPVKHGLYRYDVVDETNVNIVHKEKDCPHNKG